MNSILDRYLDRVLIYANQPEPKAEAIRKELKDHLLQKVDDLIESGVSREEATLEALRLHGSPKLVGYKLRGPFLWIDIRSHGTARGVIAIGPKAVGIFAFGGWAMGIFAFGGFSLGLFSTGGFALGLIFAWALLGVGGISTSLIAIGVVAMGGLAIGVVPSGLMTTIGVWIPHPSPIGDNFSYYTSENVPPFLKSLEPVLDSFDFFGQHAFTIFLPVYLLVIFALGYLKYREGKRVTSADDWLIDD